MRDTFAPRNPIIDEVCHAHRYGLTFKPRTRAELRATYHRITRRSVRRYIMQEIDHAD